MGQMKVEMYRIGEDVPKNISCVYYAIGYHITRNEPSEYGYLCKVGMSSNPYNRNKNLSYTHIVHCFDLGVYGLVTEKQREFVERYIQAKIEKDRLGRLSAYGGDHFWLYSMHNHEHILENFDDWAKQAIVLYNKI